MPSSIPAFLAELERRRENAAELKSKWEALELLEEKEYLAQRAAAGQGRGTISFARRTE